MALSVTTATEPSQYEPLPSDNPKTAFLENERGTGFNTKPNIQKHRFLPTAVGDAKLIKEYTSALKTVTSGSTETTKGIHFWPEDGGIRFHRNY
jgi:hypothetical protein